MWYVLILVLLVSGCHDAGSPDHSGADSGATPDVGASDAGANPVNFDGGGHLDAGAHDAGSSRDAGELADRGVIPLPPELGWSAVPNTRLRDVCPPDQDDGAGIYEFSFHCAGVIDSWNSAIADTARNRMILWGGGHGDYFGNELYALDLNSQTMTRLNDPTIPTNRGNNDNCVSEIPPGVGGFPNSRHTYGTPTHIAHADAMYVFGGSLSCGSGAPGRDTWILDLSSLTWRRMDPVTGTVPSAVVLNAFADYDPISRRVYILDRYALYSYELETNTYTLLRGDVGHGLLIHGAIDPSRQWFITVGPESQDGPGTLGIIDLSPGSDYSRRYYPEVAAGCPAMAAPNPGIAYEPSLDAMVIWGGGNRVDIFDLDTLRCTTVESPGGPGPQQETGTYGRFRYFPSLGVFAVVNHADHDAFTLRLTSGG